MSLTLLLTRYLSRQVPARPLALMRIILGLAVLATAAELFFLLTRTLDPARLHLPLLAGMTRLSSGAIHLLIGIWIGCALLLTIGLFARPAALVITALTVFVILLDKQLYSNHLYLLMTLTFWMSLSACDADLSLQRRGGGATTVAGWPVTLLQLQLCSVYVFGALSKLNPSFLSGAVIADTGALPIPLPPTLLAYLTILIELGIPLALWWPRLRWLALLAGIVLHGGIIVSMGAAAFFLAYQFATFALLIGAPYVLFFSDLLGARPGYRRPVVKT